jgi:small GTP-binding protein
MHAYDYLLKYIIVGDSSVGKSNLLARYTQNAFFAFHDMTIGVEFGSKIEECKGVKYKLQIWDTAGQESFRSITRAYYRDTCVILIVFSYNQYESFKNVVKWINEIQDHVDMSKSLVYIVGNKCDLKHLVETEDAILLASTQNFRFFEVSAKENLGVQCLFRDSVKEAHERIHELNGVKPFLLRSPQQPVEKTTRCCAIV